MIIDFVQCRNLILTIVGSYGFEIPNLILIRMKPETVSIVKFRTRTPLACLESSLWRPLCSYTLESRFFGMAQQCRYRKLQMAKHGL